MKRTAFVLCAILFMLSGHAQSFSVEKQHTGLIKDQMSLRTYGLELIGEHNDNIYFLHQPQSAIYPSTRTRTTYQISKYDENLRLLSKEPVEVYYQSNRMEFESVVLLNGKLLLITSLQNTRSKKHLLYARQINMNTLKPEGSLIPIGEIDYSDHSRYNGTRIRIAVSEDETKMMIFYTLVSAGTTVLRNGIYVYGDDLELIWKTDDQTQAIQPDGVFSYKQFRVNNQGTVTILGMNYASSEAANDKVEFERGRGLEIITTDKPNYTFQLQIFSPDNLRGDVINITLPSGRIKNMKIKELDNEMVICYGVFSEQGMTSAKGGFIFHLDLKTGRVTNLSTSQINSRLNPDCFLVYDLESFRKSIGNKQEWDLFIYKLSDLKQNSSGDYYFFAEQTLEGGIKAQYSTKPVFYFFDLFLFTMKTESGNLSAVKIPKRQIIEVTPRYLSYGFMEHNNDLYVFYNLFSRSGEGRPLRQTNFARIVKVDSAGKIEEKEIPADPKLKHHYMLPHTLIALPDGRAVYAQIKVDRMSYSFEKATIR